MVETLDPFGVDPKYFFSNNPEIIFNEDMLCQPCRYIP